MRLKPLHRVGVAVAAVAVGAASLISRPASAQTGIYGLTVQTIAPGETGTATARFNRTANCAAATSAAVPVCFDPTTGLPLIFNGGSGLNGTVVFTIADPLVASWTEANASAAAQTTGFISTASQVTRRCGFFPTTTLPSLAGLPSTTGPIGNFFGGCDSVSASYRALRPGVTTITATFIPDLPGVTGTTYPGAYPTDIQTLQVVAAPASGNVQLARGCNNVAPTVSEAASAYAARVTPTTALVAMWEHQAATNGFLGYSPQAGAPNDLAVVTRLRPLFVCVNAAATLSQPAI